MKSTPILFFERGKFPVKILSDPCQLCIAIRKLSGFVIFFIREHPKWNSKYAECYSHYAV